MLLCSLTSGAVKSCDNRTSSGRLLQLPGNAVTSWPTWPTHYWFFLVFSVDREDSKLRRITDSGAFNNEYQCSLCERVASVT